AERTGRRLDARRPPVFRMSGAPALELTEVPDVLEADRELPERLVLRVDGLHTGEVQQRIQQHRRVPHREHEAIAVRPDGIRGVEPEAALPQRIRDRGHGHGRAGMARVGLLDGIHRQRSDGVDAEGVEIGRCQHAGSVTAIVSLLLISKRCVVLVRVNEVRLQPRFQTTPAACKGKLQGGWSYRLRYSGQPPLFGVWTEIVASLTDTA